MLVGGDCNDDNPSKGLRSFPVIFDRGEDDYLRRRGRPGGEVTSTMVTP